MKAEAPILSTLDDATLLQQFEEGTLPGSAFHHREHVRVAWLYLESHPPLAALTRFTESLQRFAVAKGSPGLYHETITWAYFFLIHDRRARGEDGETWEAFAARNPDLLTWKPSILDVYYSKETLFSDLARRVFLWPSGP
ncbi:MAG TPA: hypothetical protein VHN15_04870 [Thermoanaerobaculia bacterium]|nr:hypothetical protein [Thermoanaerobaculia bacterium]